MVRSFSHLKVVPHPTLAFTLGYKPESCVKTRRKLLKKLNANLLILAVIPVHGNYRPGPERTGSVQSWPPVAEGLKDCFTLKNGRECAAIKGLHRGKSSELQTLIIPDLLRF